MTGFQLASKEDADSLDTGVRDRVYRLYHNVGQRKLDLYAGAGSCATIDFPPIPLISKSNPYA